MIQTKIFMFTLSMFWMKNYDLLVMFLIIKMLM